MKKTLVSLVAVLATVCAASGVYAGDCAASGCKPKKYRVIRISAAEPDIKYTDLNVSDYPEYRAEDFEYETYSEPVGVVSKRSGQAHRKSYKEWYIGGRVGAHMLSWKNKYKAEPASAIVDLGSDHDKYTFETVFGGGVFAGYHLTPNWRADLEFAYLTQFSDSGQEFTFKLSTPYLMANAYYDFNGGFYLGGGLGVSFSKLSMEWRYFTDGEPKDTMLGLSGALMAGFAHHLSDSLVLDFRFRTSLFQGPELTASVSQQYRDDYSSVLETLKTDVGLVWDNSFSIGLRYEF